MRMFRYGSRTGFLIISDRAKIIRTGFLIILALSVSIKDRSLWQC